ncbi:MAG TPA: pyridoxal-phosphate dependent enzyme, partial [Candidatus Limnocylindrales bacterium]
EAPADDPVVFRCPRAFPGDDIDHLMTPVVDLAGIGLAGDGDEDPFVRYRAFSHAYHVARSAGWSDERFVGRVRELERSVAAVDGHGFASTPFARADGLGDRLGFGSSGGVWVKDETANVSGSHKARHFMGLSLELLVAEELGRLAPGRPLAIASCGNAALAAAVIARATDRRLHVFVPTWAEETVLSRLGALGAAVTVCDRQPGERGDPTYLRLRDAIDDGAIPFTCQGPENGLVIGGAETLGLEMISELARAGTTLDALVVQVGGGALASASARAFDDALAVGAIGRRPRLYAVQTDACWPLMRAFDRVVGRIDAGEDPGAALDRAARHRSAFMWPWESEPHSVAHGILDDETYDWLAIVRAMLATHGRPVVVGERALREANRLAFETTGIPADHTATAGLAGLVALRDAGEIRPDETVAVLFTGIRRGHEPAAAQSTPDARATERSAS